MDAVVGEAEAQEDGVDAQRLFEPGDDGDGAAFALEDGALAETSRHITNGKRRTHP